MDSLYLLQFACFIFMLINAIILGITHLHVKWINRRYEWSRWLILAGMLGLAMQYLLQMLLGFRAKSDDFGAVINILVYTSCQLSRFPEIRIGKMIKGSNQRRNVDCCLSIQNYLPILLGLIAFRRNRKSSKPITSIPGKSFHFITSQ